MGSSFCELSFGVLWVVVGIAWVRHETREDRRVQLSEPEQDGYNIWRFACLTVFRAHVKVWPYD